jgi:hypothetical protein
VLLKEAMAEQTGASAHAGFGAGAKPFFWIGDGGCPAGPVHIAFAAASRAEVDACPRAGFAARGTDNGAPGLRPHYHANTYGTFFLDPHGNNI